VAWAATVPAEDLSVVFSDARSLAERLRSHFAPEFTMLMRTSAHPSPLQVPGAASATANGGHATGQGAVPAEVAAQTAALEGAVAAATKAVEEVAEALQVQVSTRQLLLYSPCSVMHSGVHPALTPLHPEYRHA
jgi:hypothetical protein